MARPAKIRQTGKRFAKYVLFVFFFFFFLLLLFSSSFFFFFFHLIGAKERERKITIRHTHTHTPHCTVIGFHFRTINTAGAVRAMIQKMSNGWTRLTLASSSSTYSYLVPTVEARLKRLLLAHCFFLFLFFVIQQPKTDVFLDSSFFCLLDILFFNLIISLFCC